jgi:hypothetical protein
MKLTDTQLVMLSAASQRKDGAIEVAPNLKSGASQNVNRHWIGTPDRRPKGTPLIGVFWR